MKNSIRKEILELRKQHANAEADSKKIVKNILSLPQIQNSKVFLLYYPHKNEVDLAELFKILTSQNKITLFPKTKDNKIIPIQVNSLSQLKKGNFGILEPEGREFPLEKIDVVFVPAVAFDKNGHRIGYGKGYYDRFLSNFKGIKVGVAYDFQIVDKFPTEPHDVPVDYIITPTKILKIKEDKKND